MANWNLPTITSGYLDFVTQMNDKFVDAATLLAGAPTNLPNASIRYNRTTNIFEEWDLTTWNPKVIGLLGGGTGSNTAAGARTNLGLGSMATQNSNAVNITGGSISGVNFDAGAINTGIVALARGGTGASLSLGVNGTVLLSNGTGVIFDTGVNISQLNANNLISGTVPDARLSANVALINKNNTFGANNIFTGGSTIFTSYGGGPDNFSIRAPYPLINFDCISDPPATRTMRLIYGGGALSFQALNDTQTASLVVLSIYSNGTINCNGSGISLLNASNLASGTVPIGRLGAGGSPNSGTFLRGDNTWAPATGGSGGVSFPSGMISMFDVACPTGWTRYAQLDNRFPLGSTGAGATGGSSSHGHTFDVQTDAQGAHAHGFNSATGQAHVVGDTGNSNNNSITTPGGQISIPSQYHGHHFDVYADVYNVQGTTDGVGNHSHRVSGSVSNVDQYPPWYSVVYCRKD